MPFSTATFTGTTFSVFGPATPVHRTYTVPITYYGI
jgi:hypothetical protein